MTEMSMLCESRFESAVTAAECMKPICRVGCIIYISVVWLRAHLDPQVCFSEENTFCAVFRAVQQAEAESTAEH